MSDELDTFYQRLDQFKILKILMAIFLVDWTSGIISGKNFFVTAKWRPFWKFWNIKHSFNLTSNMKR